MSASEAVREAALLRFNGVKAGAKSSEESCSNNPRGHRGSTSSATSTVIRIDERKPSVTSAAPPKNGAVKFHDRQTSANAGKVATSTQSHSTIRGADKSWDCGSCTFINGEPVHACGMCGAAKSSRFEIAEKDEDEVIVVE